MFEGFVTKAEELTPVQYVEDIFLKRDDLYQPFGEGTVNGGKLRQCYELVNKIKDDYKGLISCCSIYSPQGPITAAVGKHFNMPTVICYGGTTPEKLSEQRMPAIVNNYGAKAVIISKSGRHNILYNKAKKIAQDNNLFVVDYGFNITKYPDLLIDSISNQVKNIPDNLENLIITCGSGITTIGILVGINIFHKNIKNIILVCTAPNRKKLIDDTLKLYDMSAEYTMIDLFHDKNFKYESGVKESIGNIILHPQYEAKTYRWIKQNITDTSKTLLWIVGSYPRY